MGCTDGQWCAEKGTSHHSCTPPLTGWLRHPKRRPCAERRRAEARQAPGIAPGAAYSGARGRPPCTQHSLCRRRRRWYNAVIVTAETPTDRQTDPQRASLSLAFSLSAQSNYGDGGHSMQSRTGGAEMKRLSLFLTALCACLSAAGAGRLRVESDPASAALQSGPAAANDDASAATLPTRRFGASLPFSRRRALSRVEERRSACLFLSRVDERRSACLFSCADPPTHARARPRSHPAQA